MPALARRLELVSGRIGQSDLQELDYGGLGSQVAGLKGVKSARKLAGSMVAEHGSREFQKVKASPKKVKAAPTAALTFWN